ncbi:beta strand repeat-containing protein [Rariglobus hedericola]|uniref:PEP-CTERM sorting domain-containing protein n=1 Tax=Rariglobus hedericola TaxID=2597822 RepID=A0A556QP64_9BACT|nr:PEP-CTERM sorting domain-containing protein [Rariglobus hedericola]TSJ78417.1 PEP-CTERM sorting domain-containing protein [Rariglobus hedericola]
MNIRRYPSPFAAFSLVAAALIATTAEAADLTKLNNGTALGLAGAWSENVAPNGTQIGVFTSIWDGTNTPIYTGSTLLGIKLQSGAAPVSLASSSNSGIMTLGTEGFTLESGTQLSFTGTNGINGTIDFAGAQTWNLGSGSTLFFNTQRTLFTGDATENITLNGTGALHLSFRSDSTSFTTTLGSGSLTFTGGQRLISGSNNINSYAINSIVTNKVFVNGDITMQANSSGTLNTAGLLFSGGMDLGANDVSISLSMPNASGQNLNANQVIRLNSANTSTMTGSGTVTFLNESSDANKIAGIAVENGGTFGGGLDVVMGANTFLSVANGNALTSSTNLTLNDGGYLIGRLSGNLAATLGTLSGAGSVTYVPSAGTTVFTLTLDGGSSTGTTEFSGKIGSDSAIAGSSNAIALVKTGTNTQILSGTMNYIKATTVSGGKLLVNGTHAQSATSNGYTVASGAALGGSGRIAGFNATNNASMILVQSGGILAPGGDTTFGTFVLDGVNISGTGARVLNMASGAKFNFTLAGNGGSSDQLAFWNFATGDLLLNSNAIDLTLSGPQVAGTYTVSLFKFFSDAGSSVVSSGLASGLTIGTLGSGIDSASIAYNGLNGSIDLTYTVSAIPEPATAAMILGVLALGGTVLRRRRVKQS